jgi:hypothetical protein
MTESIVASLQHGGKSASPLPAVESRAKRVRRTEPKRRAAVRKSRRKRGATA